MDFQRSGSTVLDKMAAILLKTEQHYKTEQRATMEFRMHLIFQHPLYFLYQNGMSLTFQGNIHNWLCYFPSHFGEHLRLQPPRCRYQQPENLKDNHCRDLNNGHVRYSGHENQSVFKVQFGLQMVHKDFFK